MREADRTGDAGCGTSDAADPAAYRKNVLFLCGYRAGAGYFQDLRPGLLCRDADFDPYELYRDDFLYHECVFSGGKGNENPLHAAGGTAGNVSGNSGKHFSCGENVMMPGHHATKSIADSAK